MNAANRQHRFWIIGGAVLSVLLIAVSWFFLISPKLDDAASVRDQTSQAAQQNDVLQAKVDKLKIDSASMPSLLAALDTLHAQLPTSAKLDDLTRQITGQAATAKVTVTSIVIGVPTAVKQDKPAAPTPADAAGTGAAGSDGAGAGAATTASSADATASGSAAATTSAAPAKAAANLYAIPVTIVADGPLANQQKLLSAIQTQGPRGALVSSVQFSPVAQTAQPTGGEPAGGVRGSASGKPAPGASAPGAGGTASGTAGSAARSTGAVTTASTTTAPVPAPMSVAMTMTVQLTVFVAPQSPDDEAALRKQIGG